MIIEPKIRGFVCITAHPNGCAQKVANEVAVAKASQITFGPKNVLVIGYPLELLQHSVAAQIL